MSFKKKVEYIRLKIHSASAQDWDVKEFIDVVIEYSKFGRSEREEYRDPLVKFFNRFKSHIAQYLLGKPDGAKWGNFVSETLFGKPWDLRMAKKRKIRVASVKFERNLVSVIRSYYRKHIEEVEKHILKMKPFSAVKLGRKLKSGIVEEVQAALRNKNNRSVLNAILGQKELIKQALRDLLTDIIRAHRIKDVPSSDLEFFVDPIFKKIILEIEAKIALVREVSAA